ncbi:hypothetical protein HNP69_002975 [Chryseobacterium koreense]|nr:hypothetical protein [Chryseobacterium koreense]
MNFLYMHNWFITVNLKMRLCNSYLVHGCFFRQIKIRVLSLTSGKSISKTMRYMKVF